MSFCGTRMYVCSPPLTLAFPPDTEKLFHILLFFGSLAPFSEYDSVIQTTGLPWFLMGSLLSLPSRGSHGGPVVTGAAGLGLSAIEWVQRGTFLRGQQRQAGVLEVVLDPAVAGVAADLSFLFGDEAVEAK